jgi:aryl-alcohol dehydrogenase-like predicted oxidoreductase
MICDEGSCMLLHLRQLGQSDLHITPLGIGTAPIGSTPAWRISWGSQDEQAAIRAIHAALERGVNWIDTAPFYGWGRAEELIGNALQGKRDQVLLFTKCGTLPDGQGGWRESHTVESIRRDVEQSLRRLRTDYVDLLYLHDPDPQVAIEDSWQAIQHLIQAGAVRYAGLSNHSVDLMARAQALAPITVAQHQYNLLHRAAEPDVLPFVQQHTIGFLAWSPLASGFLTDSFDLSSLAPQDFRHRHPYAQPATYAKLLNLRQALRPIAASHGKTLSDLALAWLLRQPGVTGAMVGIRNAQEAVAMVDSLAWQLTEDEHTAIQQAVAHWDDEPPLLSTTPAEHA